MNLIQDIKENKKYYYGLFSIIFIILCCGIGALIGNSQNKKLDTFAAQLTEHAVPANSRLASTVTGTNKGDMGTESYCCLILQSELSQEELLAFYSDTDYQPARENNVATLNVYAIDEDSLENIKNTNYYREDGGAYWYIYLYSATPSH